MKRTTLAIATCTAGLLFASSALADCADELAKLTSSQGSTESSGSAQQSQGISKDGSLAPLESASDTGAGTATPQAGGDTQSSASGGSGEGIIKNGTESPLNAEDPGIATSGQEAAAQQQQAGGQGDSGGRAAAIEEARNALAAGDEEACMSAVDRARES
jgi:hypothetical protein